MESEPFISETLPGSAQCMRIQAWIFSPDFTRVTCQRFTIFEMQTQFMTWRTAYVDDAHPTLSEMMHESVLDAYGRAIHF